MIRLLALAVILTVVGCAPSQPPGSPNASPAPFGPLKGVVYGSESDVVVAVLHGDGGERGVVDEVARRVAAEIPGVTGVSLRRPGYGRGAYVSPGHRNGGRDHYTSGNNRLVAETFASLREVYKPRLLIAIGSSGGAAQTGVVVGQYPDVLDVAILQGCPCYVPEWRQHRRGVNNWLQSQSPHDFASGVRRGVRIIAITGSNDANTKPVFGRRYAALAKTYGADAEFIEVEGAGHSISGLTDAIVDLVRAEVSKT